MVRGTFANIRLKNLLVPGIEGGITVHFPDGRANVRFMTPRCATGRRACRWWSLAGKEYGTGSSRDWAAKGTLLLGVRAVIAESFERIHRSNLVGMGVLPLQFKDGRERRIAGPDRARKCSTSPGSATTIEPREEVTVTATAAGRLAQDFKVDRPARYAGGGGLLPQRRHPADGAAEVSEVIWCEGA